MNNQLMNNIQSSYPFSQKEINDEVISIKMSAVLHKMPNYYRITICLLILLSSVKMVLGQQPLVTQNDIRLSMQELYLAMGPDYANYEHPQVHILSKITEEGYERWHIKYLVDENEYCYAYLLVPANMQEGAKLPVVICPHPTTEIGKDKVVGIYPGPATTIAEQISRENRMYALDIVKKGYIAFAPDRAGYGERQLLSDGNYEAQTAAFQNYLTEKHLGFTLTGKNVYDLKIGLNVLESFDFVDKDKISILGHSLGAMDALMLIAFDSRIKAAVVNSGAMMRFEDVWWDKNSDELATYLKKPSKNGMLDKHVNLFMMMAAPRPVLYQVSPADPSNWQPNQIEAHRKIDAYYRSLTGKTKTDYDFFIHGQGHDFNKVSRDLSYTWLDEKLKNLDVVAEEAIYNPEPIDISAGYTQQFDRTGTAYPLGWTTWMVQTARQSGAYPELNPRVKPAAANASSLSYGTASSTGNFPYNFAGKLGFKNGTGQDYALVVALNTNSVSPEEKVKISFDAMTIRNLYDGVNNKLVIALALQYRIGTEGDFINLGETVRNGAIKQTSGTNPIGLQSFNFELPLACSNKPVVQLRWIAKFISGPYPADSNNNPSFAIDNFKVDAPINPLPVDLTGFTGSIDGNAIKLNWSISSENPYAHFEIFKSEDGKNYNFFERVNGKNTVDRPQDYFIYDYTPYIGPNYYKLIQYNNDGKSEQKGIVLINYNLNKPSNTLLVFPNPSYDIVNIDLGELDISEAKISVYNTSGKMVYKKQYTLKKETNTITLDLKPKLAAGQYIIEIQGTDVMKTAKLQVL